jgi:hypothetical protein
VKARGYPRGWIRVRVLRSGRAPVPREDSAWAAVPTGPSDPPAPAPGRPRGWGRWYLAIVTVIAALFAISHCWTTVDFLVLHARGVRVAAVVDRFTPQTGYAKSTRPSSMLVRFVDLQGREWTAELENLPPVTVGQTVTVVYDPEDPSVVADASFHLEPGNRVITTLTLALLAWVIQALLTGRPTLRRTLVYVPVGWLGVGLWLAVRLLA